MTPQPSISPLQNPSVTIEALGKTHPAIAQLANGTMLIPVVNNGTTTITGGEATLTARGEERHVDLERLAPGETTVLVFGQWHAMPSFELVLHCNSTDGKTRSCRT